MTSLFSTEQLVFLQQFVTSIVRSAVGEDARTEQKVEPKTKPNVEARKKPKAKPIAKPMERLMANRMAKPTVRPKAASKRKAKPKRKLRSPTDQSIKKPKASHDVASTEPLKPSIFPRNFAPRSPKENFSGPITDAYRVCLRCNRLGHLDDDCRVVIPSPTLYPNPHNPYLAPYREFVPFNPNLVYAAPPVQRLGCYVCGDLYHNSRSCPCERSVGLVRVPVNPWPEFNEPFARVPW